MQYLFLRDCCNICFSEIAAACTQAISPSDTKHGHSGIAGPEDVCPALRVDERVRAVALTVTDNLTSSNGANLSQTILPSDAKRIRTKIAGPVDPCPTLCTEAVKIRKQLPDDLTHTQTQ